MHFGAQRLVKLDRRRVPVEHRPFIAPAAAFDGDLRDPRDELLAEALAAERGGDVQVFEILPR